MTEIEKTEGEIKILQAKLELLKAMEKHKSPVEEAFYRAYGYYPTLDTDGYEGSPWERFLKGYNEGYDDGMENNKNFEKSKEIVDKHFEPTPQTPEQVEQGLRDAMKQAKKDGVFEKPKPVTLSETFYDAIQKSDRHMLVDDFCEVVEEWLPHELELDYDGEDEDYEKGWNDALRTIKNKLR